MTAPKSLHHREERTHLERARSSPDLSVAEQAALASDPSLDRVRAVATNPCLDPAVQVVLMAHSDSLVVVGLAQNPSLIRRVVVTLAAHPNWIVRGALAANPVVTLDDDLPVSFLLDSPARAAFLESRLAECDPSSTQVLVHSWTGDVRELRCVLSSLGPESR